MPRGDGTGPMGLGPGTGRRRGSGKGRQAAVGMGVGDQCVCPACGHTTKHQIGSPCNSIRCPKCGTFMVRQ